MPKIVIKGKRVHSKASERYADVVFDYPSQEVRELSVPLEYRRTGTEINDEDAEEYLEKVYADMSPDRRPAWVADQKAFWRAKPGAAVTKAFFDVLASDFAWHCVGCSLPKNPNFARRIQELKEYGYTLSTDTKRACRNCGKKKTHHQLLPIARGGITGYEVWSPALRARIVALLKNFDSFEAKAGKKEGLLPDHKFPEIRWDSETKRASLEDLSDAEILRDFQLLSNQRNQQKREVCRSCFQTGKRGTIYGIPFYYSGNENWEINIPKVGKNAERGCVGCAWYDIQAWRAELLGRLRR
jgi:hypothetical protein